MSEPEDCQYGLVMPFVVAQSNGGPYEDAAFVAGVRMEAIRGRCRAGEDPVKSYEPPLLVPQLDLVAMQYGYTMTDEPWDQYPDEWTLVTLTRNHIPSEEI